MTNKNSSSKKSQTHPKQHRIPLLQRPWFIGVIILAIVAAIIGLIIVISHNHQDNAANDGDASSAESTNKPDDNEDKPAPSEPSDDKEEQPEDKVVQFEGENPNELEELTGVVTYKGVENGNLIIDTSIDQYLTGGGTCTLRLTGKDRGHTTTIDHEAHADIATSYCETFSVSTSDFPADYYDITITVESNGKKGTIKDGVQL